MSQVSGLDYSSTMASEEAAVASNDDITTSNDEMNVSDGPDSSLVSLPQLLPQRAHRRPGLHDQKGVTK